MNVFCLVIFKSIVLKTKKEAQQVYKSLKKGKSFNSLAKTKSIDESTAANNGKIPGEFRKENLNKEFSDAIFKLSIDAPFRKELGKNAREYADNNLQYEVIMKKFEKELLELVR